MEALIARIVELEKKKRQKFPNSPDKWFWTVEEVRLPPYKITELMNKGILMKSPVGYRLINFDQYAKTAETDGSTDLKTFNELLDMIVGYDDIKELLRSSLKATGLHVLFAGPPATAKTMFLEAVASLDGSMRVNGEATTKAGLKETLLENDIRYLVIDELEKMPPKDLTILLNAMESQQIVVTQHNKRTVKELNMNVYAAINRLDKIERSIPELKSRFMVLTLKEYTPEELLTVDYHVLTKMEGIEPTLAKQIALTLIKHGFKDPRDAKKVAKVVKTNPTVEFAEKVVQMLKRYS
ncbi:MAG: hypothetical protein QXD10_10165 [Metallosphaera sp.]|uniref:hypothetical protein n=1 Tax=Metallosphaera sp. TaxID=2020860 RepID=UPI003161E6CF